MQSSHQTRIQRAGPEDARAMASLHMQCFKTSLLTALGPRVMVRLYRFLASSPTAIVVVGRGGPSIEGFAAVSLSPSGLYRDFARRRWLTVGPALAARALKPEVRRGILEITRHMKGQSSSAPELLSVVVGPPSRRMGLGSGLIMSLVEELRSAGVDRLAVVVRADNAPGRTFFELLGFRPRGALEVHSGQPSLRYEKVF